MSYTFNDVFPSPGDAVPEGDFSTAIGSFHMLPCKLCGALVVHSGQAAHIQFHNDLMSAYQALRVGFGGPLG